MGMASFWRGRCLKVCDDCHRAWETSPPCHKELPPKERWWEIKYFGKQGFESVPAGGDFHSNSVREHTHAGGLDCLSSVRPQGQLCSLWGIISIQACLLGVGTLVLVGCLLLEGYVYNPSSFNL